MKSEQCDAVDFLASGLRALLMAPKDGNWRLWTESSGAEVLHCIVERLTIGQEGLKGILSLLGMERCVFEKLGEPVTPDRREASCSDERYVTPEFALEIFVQRAG